jgi:mRNA-degrading endonuclease YafQ of YafQ-DinJ toxin-antitoxin module
MIFFLNLVSDAVESIIRILAAGDAFPVSCKDHALTGNWAHYRNAHILSFRFCVISMDTRPEIIVG